MKLETAIQWQNREKLYVSLAEKPGRTGETFYRIMFDFYNIDAEYIACTCNNIDLDLNLARHWCSGVSVTMPFKTQLGDSIDEWADIPGIANTIKIDKKLLRAYNCDLMGMRDLLTEQIRGKSVVILGDGAMAQNMFTVCEGIATVKQYSKQLGNWDERHQSCDVLVNATSVGMSLGSCPVNDLTGVDLVVDCVIGPTQLIKMAKENNCKCVSGSALYVAQFKHQFKVYTGITVDDFVVEQVAKQVFTYDY